MKESQKVKRVSLLVGLFLIIGCAQPTNGSVTLRSDDGSVSFQGTATETTNGMWTLALSAPSGLRCSGEMALNADLLPSGATRRQIEGPLQCDNGETGDISMLFNLHRGAGVANIGGRSYLAVISDR